MEPEKPKVKSLYKAVKLLDFFDAAHPERGIKELSDLSGMLKSSVYNIMQTFQMCGFIERGNGKGRYRLGNKILELGNVLISSNETGKIIKPYLDRLAEECREIVYFAVPSDTEIIYLDSAHPKGMQFARSILGVKAEMFCTSIGKAVLAFSGEELLQKVLAAGLASYTPNTLTTEKALRHDLAETRKRGYAIDNMEHEYGIRCVGFPLRNRHNAIVGAISISGPSPRITDDKLALFAERLRGVAEAIQMMI